MDINQIYVGRKVHFISDSGTIFNGKVKSIASMNHMQGIDIFVVYHCDQNWEGNDWMGYTASKTKLSDLHRGWKKIISFKMPLQIEMEI